MSAQHSNDDAVLASYGYQPAYERTLSRFASFATAFSFISVATGIFTTYGFVLQKSGPLGIWTWLVVGAGQLAVTLIFAALAARIPLSGYSYQWASRLANPTIGWLLGWVSFSFLSIVVVAVDSALASQVLPALLGYAPTTRGIQTATAILLLVQAAMIAFSTRLTTLVNSSAVAAEILGVAVLGLVLLIVALVSGEGDLANLGSRGALSTAPGYFDVAPVGPFLVSVLLGAFTIVGFESAANLAEETHRPHVVVPRAMIQAVLGSVVVGLLLLVALTVAIQDIDAMTQSATPVADIVKITLGPAFGALFLVIVGMAIFACGLVIFMTGVRLTWAMSRDRRFPGHQLFGRIHTQTSTPLWATMLILALGLVWTWRLDKLSDLFSASTLLPALIYTGTVILYIATKKRQNQLDTTEDEQQRRERFSLGRWEVPVIAVALLWLALELWVLMDAQFRTAQLYVLGMIGVGLVYSGYLHLRRLVGLAGPG